MASSPGRTGTVEQPLGDGGDQLHEWIVGLASWRERQGMSEGERNADDEVVRESLDTAGAVLMGRACSAAERARGKRIRSRTGGGETIPVPRAGVRPHPPPPGDRGEARWHVVHLCHGRPRVSARPGSPGGRRQRRRGGGGANVVQQCLNAGLLDQMQIHLVPAFLGEGVKLFDQLDDSRRHLEVERAIHSPAVTHVKYRVVR
jgi:hypothetical protein